MRQLFVSDVHLDAGAPGATEQFLNFLAHEAREAAALYILGDLFEAWVGDDDTDADKARVSAGLKALSDSGVAVFILHGNRDFLLGEAFAAASGARLLPDPVIIRLGAEEVLLTHGDALCVDDRSYQELRSVVRDGTWQRRFLTLPRANRELLADGLRAGSRAHTSRTVPYIMDVNAQAVEAALRAARVRRMIHGHTHRPGVHEMILDGAAAQRMVLGAWYEQGSYLEYADGAYRLRELPRTAS